MNEELTSLLEGIQTADKLEEAGIISGLANVAGNAIAGAAKNVGHAIKAGVQGAYNSAKAGIQNVNNNIQQKQAGKDLDNKLENLANSLSSLLTDTAAGDKQKDADKAKAASVEANNVKRNANKELQNAEKEAKEGGDKGAQV